MSRHEKRAARLWSHVLSVFTGYAVGVTVSNADALSWSRATVANGGDVLALLAALVVTVALWSFGNWLTK